MVEKLEVLSDIINRQEEQENKSVLKKDMQRAVLVAAAVTGLTLAGSLIINVSSGSEARALLSAMLPSIRFLSSAVMTAAATTLALMLAMVGFGQSSENRLKSLHYERVEQIARWNSIVFVGATSFLLFISIPLPESQEVPVTWSRVLYYSVLFYSGILTGALTFVIFLLYKAITSLINVLHPNRQSDIIVDTNEENKIEVAN
jgi:hypothetical protein